jgi:hypothetical protein
MADNAPLKTNNLVFTNNLSTRTSYGFFGGALGEGINALNGEFANWIFLRNVIVGANATNQTAGNFFPANLGAVRFVDYASGDYRLAAGSPYKNAGTDGLDVGANLSSAKLAATSVVAPANPPMNIVVR